MLFEGNTNNCLVLSKGHLTPGAALHRNARGQSCRVGSPGVSRLALCPSSTPSCGYLSQQLPLRLSCSCQLGAPTFLPSLFITLCCLHLDPPLRRETPARPYSCIRLFSPSPHTCVPLPLPTPTDPRPPTR